MKRQPTIGITTCRTPHTRNSRARATHLLRFAVAILPALALACESTPDSRQPRDPTLGQLRDEGAAVFGSPASAPENTRGSRDLPRDATAWSIVLSQINPDQEHRAEDVLSRVRTAHGLAEARLERRSGGLVILYGRYDGPESSRARQDLQRIQRTTVEGRRPYRFAFLSPPHSATFRGGNPEHDLRNARRRYGPTALYTLQIGVYGRSDARTPSPQDLAEFRRTAEQAVATLRAEGELAFYYHGPNQSIVTVGVFGSGDHDPSVPTAESQRLRDARERHPHNLLNGRGIRERVRTDTGVREIIQSSALVMIPD